MSSLHTQGKWLVEEETCVVNEEGYAIADCNLGWSSINELQEQKANALRIALSVNACDALSIEELRIAKFTSMTTDYVIKYAKVKQQCDALQAKLDAVMLEYCPEEMTGAQLETWGDAQKVSESR